MTDKTLEQKLIIVGGDKYEVDKYMRSRGLTWQNVSWVRSKDTIRGFMGNSMVILGNIDDMKYLLDYAQQHNIRKVNL